MRWNKKKIPEDGEERVIKKFLSFPKCINGVYCWLESVKIKQKCHWHSSYDYDTGITYDYYKWCDMELVDG